MIVCCAGHQPDKIGGSYLPNDTYNYVCRKTKEYLEARRPSFAVSGLALGYEQWFASIALSLGIPLIAVLPCRDQSIKWKDSEKRIYDKLIGKSKDTLFASESDVPDFHARNEVILNTSDNMLCAFNGEKGNTYSYIIAARSKNKGVMVIPAIPSLDRK